MITKLCLRYILRKTHIAYLKHISGISWTYLSHISGLTQAYLKLYLILYLNLSQAKLRHIRIIFLEYIRCFSDIFHLHFRHRSEISQIISDHISNYSQVYIRHSSGIALAYLKYITNIFLAYLRLISLRHISGLFQVISQIHLWYFQTQLWHIYIICNPHASMSPHRSTILRTCSPTNRYMCRT